MTFTVRRVDRMSKALRRAAGVLLSPLEFQLHDGGKVTVRAHVSARRANEAELTAGAVASANLICTIDAQDWNAAVQRPPYRGDVVTFAGRRYALEKAHLAAPGQRPVFYKADLAG